MFFPSNLLLSLQSNSSSDSNKISKVSLYFHLILNDFLNDWAISTNSSALFLPHSVSDFMEHHGHQTPLQKHFIHYPWCCDYYSTMILRLRNHQKKPLYISLNHLLSCWSVNLNHAESLPFYMIYERHHIDDLNPPYTLSFTSPLHWEQT